MRGNKIKARVDSKMRGRALAVIIFFAIFALFCITMAVYDITTGRTAFGVLFAIAAFLFVILMLLRANSVFGTYIKVEDGVLYMKSWANDFLPYDINGGMFSDMVPAKTKVTEIPADEISMILIGTKEYVKRNATIAGKRLARALYPYEHSRKRSKKEIISGIDLFYVETYGGECSFMCIYGYSPEQVVNVIGELYDLNSDISVSVSSKEYKRHIKALQRRIDSEGAE